MGRKNVLDKIRKFRERNPQNTDNGSRLRGIYHDWKDGDNIVRLVGEFLEVKTHFIAPNPKRKERGMCNADAFKGDQNQRIPQVINCLDWDMDKEETKKEQTCPICKLGRIARAVLGTTPTDEEKDFFKKLSSEARARTQLKWNVFDRKSPSITVEDASGNASQQLGYKIGSIGMEAWADIEGIFAQLECDISDPEDGVDINVIRGHNGTRTTYSARAVMEGKAVKSTPLTDEERELELHDLKARARYGNIEASKVVDNLHDDYAELLELDDEDEEEVAEEKVEEKVEKKAEEKVEEADTDETEDEFGGLDEDPLEDTSVKKKIKGRKRTSGQ